MVCKRNSFRFKNSFILGTNFRVMAEGTLFAETLSSVLFSGQGTRFLQESIFLDSRDKWPNSWQPDCHFGWLFHGRLSLPWNTSIGASDSTECQGDAVPLHWHTIWNHVIQKRTNSTFSGVLVTPENNFPLWHDRNALLLKLPGFLDNTSSGPFWKGPELTSIVSSDSARLCNRTPERRSVHQNQNWDRIRNTCRCRSPKICVLHVCQFCLLETEDNQFKPLPCRVFVFVFLRCREPLSINRHVTLVSFLPLPRQEFQLLCSCDSLNLRCYSLDWILFMRLHRWSISTRSQLYTPVDPLHARGIVRLQHPRGVSWGEPRSWFHIVTLPIQKPDWVSSVVKSFTSQVTDVKNKLKFSSMTPIYFLKNEDWKRPNQPEGWSAFVQLQSRYFPTAKTRSVTMIWVGSTSSFKLHCWMHWGATYHEKMYLNDSQRIFTKYYTVAFGCAAACLLWPTEQTGEEACGAVARKGAKHICCNFLTTGPCDRELQLWVIQCRFSLHWEFCQ